jgi:hypothetical protein
LKGRHWRRAKTEKESTGFDECPMAARKTVRCMKARKTTSNQVEVNYVECSKLRVLYVQEYTGEAGTIPTAMWIGIGNRRRKPVFCYAGYASIERV